VSWVEAFNLAGVDVSTPGVADYTRGSIITWGVSQGWSNNRIQREISSLGIGISVGQLDPMVRAERSRQGANLTSTQLGMDYSAGSLVAPEPPDNWTGQYVHQVTMVYREAVGANQYELHTRTVGLKSSVPLTPSQATQAAFDIMTPELGEPGTPDMPDMAQVLTSQLTGIWYDTQGRAIPTAQGGVA